MKTLLQELFEISCVIVGLYVGYLLIKHIWLVFDISPTGTLFFILALFTYYVWLSRNYKYGLYRLLKDIHQSNLEITIESSFFYENKTLISLPFYGLRKLPFYGVRKPLSLFKKYGGGRGIRTLDTVRYTRFPSVRDRPLCHPS